MSLYYRVANVATQQRLWYNFDGTFTGLIHDKFSFCKNHDLPMPYDEELKGWLSATDRLGNLFHWFSLQDIKRLEEFGYKICIYETDKAKIYKNHWVISQYESILKGFIDVDDLLNPFGLEEVGAILQRVRDSCYQALDGSWEINDEGFELMAESCANISTLLGIKLGHYEKEEDGDED